MFDCYEAHPSSDAINNRQKQTYRKHTEGQGQWIICCSSRRTEGLDNSAEGGLVPIEDKHRGSAYHVHWLIGRKEYASSAMNHYEALPRRCVEKGHKEGNVLITSEPIDGT
jgi:hypothetical protein